MFLKDFSNLTGIFLLLSSLFGNILAENEECNKINIEGSSQALIKFIQDFSQMNQSSTPDCRIQNEAKRPTKDQPLLDLRYDNLPKNCVQERLPKDCAEATTCTKRSGIYKLEFPEYSFEPFYVECDATTADGDWLLIQRRHDGSVDFFRNWDEYEKGFGDIEGEFFIGLKKLYALTNLNGPQELLIVMKDVNATKVYAKYDAFAIGDDKESYKLKRLGEYTGTAGDSLTYHLNMKFSTKDRDNDTHATLNCAANFTGAWWYGGCHHSNLNGKYGDNSYGKGINWKHFRGVNASLKYTKMMIRRRRTST
ncbi:microfibril-associated glycoprotein 4-like [Cochliomyia hominivorax]